jgi:hypothetical protein
LCTVFLLRNADGVEKYGWLAFSNGLKPSDILPY